MAVTSFSAAAQNYSTPIENCVKAAEVVKSNDAATLKPLVRDLSPEAEKAMVSYLAKGQL